MQNELLQECRRRGKEWQPGGQIAERHLAIMHMVRVCAAQMPPLWGRVLVMRYVFGYEWNEMTTRLGLPRGVLLRVHRQALRWVFHCPKQHEKQPKNARGGTCF